MEQQKFEEITSSELFYTIIKAIGLMPVDNLIIAVGAIEKMEVTEDVRGVLLVGFSAMANYKLHERKYRQMSNEELVKESEDIDLPEFAQSIIARILIERVPEAEEFELLVEKVLN